MTSENDSQYGANDTIGAYVILDRIHGGGMGQVYRARPKTGGELVAIKVCVESGYYARFRREVELMQRLPEHKNLMRILDANLDVSPPYFVMPLAVKSVRDEMGEDGGDYLSQERAVEVVIEVCEALATIHRNQLIHRDVKPDNILIMSDSAVVLADFGLCKDLDAGSSGDLTRTGKAIGTPKYSSPEQMQTPGNVDHRTDIYSLGLTLRELLSGQIDEWADSVNIDGAILSVINKSTQRQRSARYIDMEAMKNALLLARELLEADVDTGDLEEKIHTLNSQYAASSGAEYLDESCYRELCWIFGELRKMVKAGDGDTLSMLMKVGLEPWFWREAVLSCPGALELLRIVMYEAAEKYPVISESERRRHRSWDNADKAWRKFGFFVQSRRDAGEYTVDEGLFVAVFYFLFVISTSYDQYSAMDGVGEVLRSCRGNAKLSQKLAEVMEKDRVLGLRFFEYQPNDSQYNSAVRMLKKKWAEEQAKKKVPDLDDW